VRVTRRAEYMAALERASLHRDIGLFTEFVAQEMAVEWAHDLSQAERATRHHVRKDKRRKAGSAQPARAKSRRRKQ
jgi:hypothetical protein